MNISKQEVKILYNYIVKGQNMENSGAPFGWSISEVSQLIHDFGFNRNKKGAYQKGEDCGRYKPGKPDACGLKITSAMIEDYAYNCEYWDYSFADYVQAAAEDMQAELRRQQAIRAENDRREWEREAQEQMRLEWVKEQQEKQRQREEAAKREAEQKKRDYPKHLDAARKYLRSGNLQQALDEANKAFDYGNTWEAYILIAEILASAGNAGQHAAEITQKFTEYRNSGGKLNAEQLLWLARAELQLNRRNDACNDYFRAADIWYDKSEFARADSIYTEAIEKTNLYSGVTPDGAFRAAYCRSKKKSLTEDDHRFCEKWFEIAADNDQYPEEALGLRTVHLRALHDHWETYHCAQDARDAGNTDDYVLQNLLWATVECGNESEALELIEEMEDSYVSFEPWLKGETLRLSSDHDDAEAVEWFDKQLKLDPDHPKALLGLCFALVDTDRARSCSCGLKYLKTFKPVSEKDDYNYNVVKDMVLWQAKACGRRDLLDAALEYHPDKKAKELEARANQDDALHKLQQAQLALKQDNIPYALGLLNAIDSSFIYGQASAVVLDYHAAAGEALARSQDADQNAPLISFHLNALMDSGKTLSAEQYLWLARACVNSGERDKAVYMFFRAGDIFFEAGSYRRADEIYTEAINAANSCSGYTAAEAYRAAFAREQVTPDDHDFCQEMYSYATADESLAADACRRRFLHLSKMGIGYGSEAMSCAWSAVSMGAMTADDYLVMMDTAITLERWGDACEAAELAEKLGADIPAYNYCRSLLKLGYATEALNRAEQFLQQQPQNSELLDILFTHCPDPLRCAKAGLAWLRATYGGNRQRAAEILQFAEQTGDKELISSCLKYNPAEKQRREDEEMLLILM